MTDNALQEQLEALDPRRLRIVAKKLKIKDFKRQIKTNLIRTILGAIDESAIRNAASFTWWDIHQNQVFGYGSLALGLLALIITLFGIKSNPSVPAQTATPMTTLLPAPSLIAPSNGSIGLSTIPTFGWSPVLGANRYWLTVATNLNYLPTDPGALNAPGCVIGANGVGIEAISYTPSLRLNTGTTYYWKVQAYHVKDGLYPNQQGQYSGVRSFTTATAVDPTATPQPATPLVNDFGVTLYTDPNYGGQSHSFGVGDYDLSSYGLDRNVSSLRDENAAYHVVFYDIYGNIAKFDKDVPQLPAEMNDQAHSMHVELH